MIKKILISIAALISILLFCLLIVYNYNSYKLSSDQQIQANYSEAQSRIKNFENSIKLPPENISKEENGHYWYSEAFKTMPEDKLGTSEGFIEKFLENPEKANFKDKETSKYLAGYEKIFNLISEGNKCKYFDFTELSGFIDKVPDYANARCIVFAYSLKTCCYINSGQYAEASETLHECFTFIRCLSKNHTTGDIKLLISFMIEMAFIKITDKPLNLLLEKSSNPYPTLRSDIKLFLSDISNEELKKSLDLDMTMMLFSIDQMERGKGGSIAPEDIPVAKNYKMLKNEAIERQHNLYMSTFIKLYNSLYYKKFKASVTADYKDSIFKYTNKTNLIDLKTLKEESEKDYTFTHNYFLFQIIPSVSPNVSKIAYRCAETEDMLEKIEKKLEERE